MTRVLGRQWRKLVCLSLLVTATSTLRVEAEDACSEVLSDIGSVEMDKCLAPDVYHPKPVNSGATPVEAVLTYQPITRIVSGKPRCQIVPNLVTYAPTKTLFDKVLSMFPSNAAGHELSNAKITGETLVEPNSYSAFAAAQLTGTVHVEKHAKFEYPCIKDWSLTWCDGWTFLYEFTPGWKATIRPVGISYHSVNPSDADFRRVDLGSGRFDNVRVDDPSTGSPHRASTYAYQIHVPKGSSNFDLEINNDLVKLFESLVRSFGTFLQVLDAHYLGLLNINYEQFQRFDIEQMAEDQARKGSFSENIYFVRNIANEQVGNQQYPHTTKQGREESKTLTAILDSFFGERTDYTTATFTGTAGRFVRIVYSVDYSKLLDRIYSTITTDPLYPPWFCGTTKAGIANEMRQILEGDDTAAISLESRPWLKYEQEGQQLFGKRNLSLAIEEFRAANAVADDAPITRSAAVEYFKNRLIARNFSNLADFSRFIDLSQKERDCIKQRILEKSGNINLVYPGQDFQTCLIADALSEEQQKVIDELDNELSLTGFWDSEIATSSSLEIPIKRPQLRGWYYCYRQNGLCGSTERNVVRWDPQMSTFHGRPGGKHDGYDLFDENHSDGKSQIYSISAGKVFYRNVGDWGHTIFLPFRYNSKDYYAVYAHLDAGSKSLDGTILQAGQQFYTTSCSGNAGDGNGVCNAYCKVGGVYRTDEHLHFEILSRGSSGANKPVDPKEVFPNWQPVPDTTGKGNKICSECKDGNCVAKRTEDVISSR